MNRRQKKKLATNTKIWRRLVSATFLVGPHGFTLTKHRMMELGVPVARIERMHETLPLLHGDTP